MWVIGGVGRVFRDGWLSLYMVGEPFDPSTTLRATLRSGHRPPLQNLCFLMDMILPNGDCISQFKEFKISCGFRCSA